MHLVTCNRRLAGLFLALLPALEDHFEGDPEEQQATRDPEGADRDAEQRQHAGAGQREDGEDAECNQRAAQRHLLALGAIHADRQAEEYRRQPRRVDRHEKRRDGVDE